jgi:chromosome segregation ATPase
MPQTQPLPFPQRPEDRLRLALRDLEAALDDQARAVAEFRADLGVLGQALGALQDGLHTYRGRLAECQLDLAELRDEALKLERTAGGWAAPG